MAQEVRRMEELRWKKKIRLLKQKERWTRLLLLINFQSSQCIAMVEQRAQGIQHNKSIYVLCTFLFIHSVKLLILILLSLCHCPLSSGFLEVQAAARQAGWQRLCKPNHGPSSTLGINTFPFSCSSNCVCISSGMQGRTAKSSWTGGRRGTGWKVEAGQPPASGDRTVFQPPPPPSLAPSQGIKD